MKMPKITKPVALILIGVFLLITGITFAAITYLTIPSQGTILTSASLSANPTPINWGDIPEGSTTPIDKQVTLTNTGQQATSPLHISCTTPIGTVTWNGENLTIGAGASQLFTFTLTPSATAPTGPFSFDITITA